MLYLRSADPDETRTWPLGLGQHVVGRVPGCRIHLDDPRVSRRHARIDVTEESVSVSDLGSSNGVFVNGARVQTATLHPGDRLGFGPIVFSVLESPADPLSTATQIAPSEPEAGPQIFERGHLTAAPPLDSQRLQVLYAIVETLVANLHLDEILPNVLETLNRLFDYDRCAIAGRDASGRLVTWASRPPEAQVPYSRSIVQRVLERAEALLYDDVQGEAPFALGESVVGLNIRSVLCSPLMFRGRVQGLVYLDRSVAGAYTMDDLALLRSVSHLVAIALENARLYADLKARYHKTADELMDTQRRLIESERTAALGRLAQAVAHEVRNPVMVIGGLARRLAKGPSTPEITRTAQGITAEARRLERMMERVEALIHLPEPHLELLPLETTVDTALGEIRHMTEASGIRVGSTSALAYRPVPYDPELTRAALVAVLQNAVHAATAGCEIRISVHEVDEGWVVEVAEAGGEETTDFKGIFDPLFTSHPWAVDLGLAFAQKAMAQQGGELRLGEDATVGAARVQLLLRHGAAPETAV